MAELTRKAFAAYCGITEVTLNLNVARKKVSPMVINKKLLDTGNPLNKAFIDRWQRTNFTDKGLKIPKLGSSEPEITEKVAKIAKNKANPVTEQHKAIKEAAEPREIRQKIEAQNAKDQKRVDQESAKTDQAMELTALKIQREQFLLSKAAGKLLPVEMVEGIVKRHANSILKEFDKGIEQLADIFCNIMAGGDPKMRVRILTDGKKMLSRCILNAGEAADIELEQMVDDYSESLLRGQKKV